MQGLGNCGLRGWDEGWGKGWDNEQGLGYGVQYDDLFRRICYHSVETLSGMKVNLEA